MYDATVSLQTGFEQQRRLASDFQSENRKSYLPVAVAGGHLRRRPLSLFGLTPGTRLAPVQFELHGSYQVSKSGLLQDFSLSKKNAYPMHLSSTGCEKFNIPFSCLYNRFSFDSLDKY